MYRLEHRRLPGMNIPAGRHAEAALQSGGEVGDDVAEHIVGHDHIEPARIADHLQAQRVYVHVLRRDLRMLAAYLLKDALPQAARVGHGIRLVAHEHALAGRTVELGVALTIFEGIADGALDTLARVDVLLNRDFIRRSLLEDSTRIGIDTLGVFADDDEIHVLGLDAFYRTQGR